MKILSWIAGLLAAMPMLAMAGEVEDVAALQQAGKPHEALARAERFLVAAPRDPRMRFLLGMLLAEQKKADEAIEVLRKLTDDYPELAEPYNNLAVQYAAAGQLEKARATLETAIRLRPDYATAFDNLGDVQIALAKAAYDKAVLTGADGGALQSKRALLRALMAATANPAAGDNAAAPGVSASAGMNDVVQPDSLR